MTGDSAVTKERLIERLIDTWETTRSALRSGSFLFEAAMTGYVAVYTALFTISPHYWQRLGSVITGEHPEETTYWIQCVLLVIGAGAIVLTIVGSVRHHLYGLQRMRWRRAATVMRGVFLFFLSIVQFLVVPQWPGPALVSLWLSICSLLHETGQEIDVEERSKGILP